MHGRIGDVLEIDGYVPLPRTYALVVRRGHETSIVVDERDRVDSAQVTIVLLRDLARARVKTQDLLVRRARHKQVLFVLVRIEYHTVGYLFVGELRLHLTRLGVPQLDQTIVGSRQELGTRSIE